MPRYSTIAGLLALILLAGSPFIDPAAFVAVHTAGLFAALAAILSHAFND